MASVAVSASGAASGGQQGQSHDSDAASIDWDTTPVLSWMHPVFTGRSIIARGGHASTLVGNLMITFGGHYFGKEKFEYVHAALASVSFMNAPPCAPCPGIAMTCGQWTWTR